MARCDKHAFGRCAQSSPEVVDFGAPDCVSPALHLGLDMSSSEEIIFLIDVCVHVYSTVATRPRDGNLYESCPLEYELDEMFKVVRRKLEQPHPNSFPFHGCCFSLLTIVGEGGHLALRNPQRIVPS